MSNQKNYVKPAISVIELKTEERLAGSLCQCSGHDSSHNVFSDHTWHI